MSQLTRYDDVRRYLLQELSTRLPALHSRTTDDVAVALLDGWACAAEILGFHSARIYEECYLDTATELRSLIELSRLIGYRPDPGVAASASLAFTIDAAGAAESVTVPTGTAVTSSPSPGERPVTYETVADIESRPAWNALRPRLGGPQLLGAKTNTVLLAGTATGVMPGDGIVLPYGDAKRLFAVVAAVEVRPDDSPVPGSAGRTGWTTLRLNPLGDEWPEGAKLPDPPNSPIRGPLLTELTAGGLTITAEQLRVRARAENFDTADVIAALRADQADPGQVLVFRAQSSILGSTAPEFATLPDSLREALQQVVTVAKPDAMHGGTYHYKRPPVWADGTLEDYPGAIVDPGRRDVLCDSVLRSAAGPVVLRDGDIWQLLSVSAVRTTSRSMFTVSGKGSALTVHSKGLAGFSIRGTTVFTDGEWLPLAARPDTSPLPHGGEAATITLSDWVDGLTVGQLVAITGASASEPGTRVAHVAQLTDVVHDLTQTGTTSITLDVGLPADLVRDSALICANVAPATHGETRSEVLGSGDARDPMPTFVLSAAPLTYLATKDGSTSTLRVRVNGVLRTEVPALQGPGDRGYLVDRDDTQRASVQFSAPLPTGDLNVRAEYRVGLGFGAAAQAGQLTLLTQRPQGVRGVTNPLPARGGADPESVEGARRNAPVSVRALGRVVSLIDHADFARAYPGIAKAAAGWSAAGGRRGVLVTVAGARGAAVTTDSDIYRGLLAGLHYAGDGLVTAQVTSYQAVPFRVAARVRTDPRLIAAEVRSAAIAAVSTAFGFDARDLGQGVAASEFIAVLQAVPGVVAADIGTMHRLVNGDLEGKATYRPYLPAVPPNGANNPHAAVLLTLDLTSLDLQAEPAT